MIEKKKFTVSLILLAFCLTECVNSLSSYYETELIFYHEQVFPKDYYWVIMQSEYEGDELTTGADQLLSNIQKLKHIVNKHNDQKNSSLVSSQSTNQDIKLLIGQQSQTEAFSHKITQQIQAINQYYLALGKLDIHLNNPISINQQIYIRVPSKKRQQLSRIVDQINSEFNESQTLRILSIQKGNMNSFSSQKMGELYKQNVEELIDEQKLITSIHQQGEKYCHSLYMELNQILQYHPLIDEELYNQTQQITQSQQTLQETVEQLSYDEAYQVVNNKQFYDYENVFYQVKALCKGNQKPKQNIIQTKTKTKIKNSKKHHKPSNKHKIQSQLNKLNQKLKNQQLA